PEKVYSSVMILGFVRLWCIQFPHGGRMFLVNAKVMQKRIQDVLLIPDVLGDEHLKPNTVTKGDKSPNSEGAKTVSFYNFTAAWSKKAPKTCLEHINITLNRGEVTAVIGKIGSGKTSFLLSFLREIPETQGYVSCK